MTATAEEEDAAATVAAVRDGPAQRLELSPWWRAVNEGLLRDAWHRAAGERPARNSEPAECGVLVRLLRRPSAETWYRATTPASSPDTSPTVTSPGGNTTYTCDEFLPAGAAVAGVDHHMAP
jgi:hypothetical protein